MSVAEKLCVMPQPDCVCGAEETTLVFDYTLPPDGETRFPSIGDDYRREVLRCDRCGHYVSRHWMCDTRELYAGEYNEATYGDALLDRFTRIVNLPPESSDNEGRVRRLAAFAKDYFTDRGPVFKPSALDIGSGLCVFMHRLKREGWECTALDPDERSAAHARDVVDVNAICGDFLTCDVPARFDVVSFNKVLEHVLDPVAMLRKATRCLHPGGMVYVELPDGEAAEAMGPGREEFFIDHHHVFSMASVSILAQRAGFAVLAMERLVEPSGKYTIRAFLRAAGQPGR